MKKLLDKRIFLLVFAFSAVFVESFANVFMKLAARTELFSLPCLLLFCCALGTMAIYAIMWQYLLERLPLSTAYLRKGISYILIFVWAMVFFLETIRVNQIVGAAVIIVGMVVSMKDD